MPRKSGTRSSLVEKDQASECYQVLRILQNIFTRKITSIHCFGICCEWWSSKTYSAYRDSTSTETTELEISGELAPDTKSKVVSALYNNPTYWQGVLSEANQFMLMQLFQEVQRGQFESGASKLSADQTLERLRSAEQSIEMLQVKCEKKETHIFELEHRIKERNRQIEQLEKVVRRRSSAVTTSRYNASSSSSSAPVQPPSRRQYLNENQRRHMNLRSVEVEQGVSGSTSFSSSSSLFEYRPTTTSRAATSTVLSNRTNTMPYRPPSPPPASSSRRHHHHHQIQPEHKTITTKKTPRTSSSFRPKTPGLDALLREQEMLFNSSQ